MELLITELIRKEPLLQSRGFFMPCREVIGGEVIGSEGVRTEGMRREGFSSEPLREIIPHSYALNSIFESLNIFF